VWTGCWKELLAQVLPEYLLDHTHFQIWRLDFADDVALLSELLELLVPALDTMAPEAESLGLELN